MCGQETKLRTTSWVILSKTNLSIRRLTHPEQAEIEQLRETEMKENRKRDALLVSIWHFVIG